jgi:hypothetical protein
MLTTLASLRPLSLIAVAGLLAACSVSGENLGETREELGDFRLCYNIVTTNDAVRGPLSREADVEVIADVMRDEIDRRFLRYEGSRLYHIALHLDAYVLAVPGVPLVASPRSALIVSANVWDDALGRPLNEEPKQFTVLESAGANSVLGSGLTQSAEEQTLMLARNMALQIENWLAENPEWFEHEPAVDAEEAETAEAPESEAPEGERGEGNTCGHR